MRIKVVDMYSDGDIECLTDDRNNDFLRVSHFNLLRAIGVKEGVHDLTDQEVFDLLKGKEFIIDPIIDRIIPSRAEVCTQNRWTYHEINCKWCGQIFCTCGEDYEPETTN